MKLLRMKRITLSIIYFTICLSISGQQVYQMQNRLRGDDAIERKQVQANGFNLEGMNNVWSLEDIPISSKTFKTEYTIAGDTLTGLERGNRIYYRQANGLLSYKIDSAKYICAYNYIKENTTAKRIQISRCVVDLDRWVFPIDSLTDYPEEKNALIAFVERKKNERNKESFSDEITIQTPAVKRPQNILYFSQIENNMLVACLLPFDKRRHRMKDIDKFDIISRFNESENFLFIFDENNIIKKVLKVLVCYD